MRIIHLSLVARVELREQRCTQLSLEGRQGTVHGLNVSFLVGERALLGRGRWKGRREEEEEEEEQGGRLCESIASHLGKPLLKDSL